MFILIFILRSSAKTINTELLICVYNCRPESYNLTSFVKPIAISVVSKTRNGVTGNGVTA